jgi:hypothetical protein
MQNRQEFPRNALGYLKGILNQWVGSGSHQHLPSTLVAIAGGDGEGVFWMSGPMARTVA